MTRKYPKFCDPTNDWAFKRIFGSEQYKDATIGFINSMLPEKQIHDVEFLNVEIPGFTVEDRKSCVDILCRGNDGSSFVIEMQVVEQEFLKDGNSIDPATGKAALKDGKMVNERLYRTILQYGQEFEYNGVTMRYYGEQDVETGFQINKWMEPFKHADFVNTGYVNQAGGSWPSARVNFHVMRFADALLLRAEAYLHNNKATDAAKDLNAIRKRAGLAENCTGTWEELYHERVCKLMFEPLSDAAIDLKRWAVGEGVGSWLKTKAIACLEGHPRALFHVWRAYWDSPVGQGENPTGDPIVLGTKVDPTTGKTVEVKGLDYASIKTNLGDDVPGVGPYPDYIDMNKNAKWDAHLAVFPYPSNEVSKSAGALKQNAGY